MGSLTLTTVSDFFQTSPAAPSIVAPALWYSSSRKPDCAPAFVSTNTLCPSSVSAFTPAGVTPTRASLSLISLGTPIIIVVSPVWFHSGGVGCRPESTGYQELATPEFVFGRGLNPVRICIRLQLQRAYGGSCFQCVQRL